MPLAKWLVQHVQVPRQRALVGRTFTRDSLPRFGVLICRAPTTASPVRARQRLVTVRHLIAWPEVLSALLQLIHSGPREVAGMKTLAAVVEENGTELSWRTLTLPSRLREVHLKFVAFGRPQTSARLRASWSVGNRSSQVTKVPGSSSRSARA
jgi:hypothetical protein